MDPAEGPRIGDLLWGGRAQLQAPHDATGAFFPRQKFASLVLPSGVASGGPLLFLGGQKARGGWCCNDIWRLTLTKTSWRDVNWKLISAHDEGGEDAAGNCLNDLWASQDGGLSWRCMSQASPWSPGVCSALLAVPGRPERLLLCGGLMTAAEVCQDLWLSDDAGFSWHRLPDPSWAHITGRFRAQLVPLEAGKVAADEDQVGILILGGCFIDGGEGGGFGGYERLMHNCWEGRVDFATKAVEWTPWGSQMDERGRRWARVGMDASSCTKGPQQLVALLPGHEAVSVAAVQRPEGEALPWQAAQAQGILREALRRDLARSISLHDGCGQCHVRLSWARRAVPRLVLAYDEGILVSGFGEWQRQLTFLLLLGLRLERSVHRLCWDLWRRRIVPALLPGVT